MSGEELAECLSNRRTHQFSLVAFSALPRGVKPASDLEPYADGNPALWRGHAKPQLPEAIFEIVAFESSHTLFIGLPEHLKQRLVTAVPDIKLLDTFTG